jgi:DNA-binding FadR family transcriptional regulator
MTNYYEAIEVTRPPTSTEIAEAAIRAAISLGEIPADSRVPAATVLAQQFGVSRSAVGFALRRLAEARVLTQSIDGRTLRYDVPAGS